MTDEPILELSSLAPERPKARLRTKADPEGTVYELSVPDDFGAVTLARIGQLINKVDELWAAGSLTAAKERQLEQTLNKVTKFLIREVPEESVAALPAVQKRTLAMRFLAVAGEETMMVFRHARVQTSESLSPDSKPLLEETP